MSGIDLLYKILDKDMASEIFKGVAKTAGDSFDSVEKSAESTSTATGKHWWNKVGSDGQGSVHGAVTKAAGGMKMLGAAAAGILLAGGDGYRVQVLTAAARRLRRGARERGAPFFFG